MTVRETLEFRVELKLGSKISKKARSLLVRDLVIQMKLEKTMDTLVGDAKVRGISGGERRRLAIACELISSPSVIFLDEPTSGKFDLRTLKGEDIVLLTHALVGLDSTAASGVIDTLRDLADSGKTVVAVIHQPSQHVFASFDDLLLVSEGKQMYFGESSKVRDWMQGYVKSAPAEMGTAEFILDCISKTEMVGENSEDVGRRLNKLADLARTESVDIGMTDGEVKRYVGSSGRGPRASIFVQLKLLFRRALRENFRGKAKLIIQTVQQVSLGIIYGGIYTIGKNQVCCCNDIATLTVSEYLKKCFATYLIF